MEETRTATKPLNTRKHSVANIIIFRAGSSEWSAQSIDALNTGSSLYRRHLDHATDDVIDEKTAESCIYVSSTRSNLVAVTRFDLLSAP